MERRSPFLRRVEQESKSRAHGRKAEKVLSKKLNHKLTPGSGAFRQKGDIKAEVTLLEVKSSISGSISIKHYWLKKITEEALSINRMPALAINFVDAAGKTVQDGAWVAIPLWAFKEKF